MQATETSFLSGPNAAFVVQLYARYAEDPQAVEPSWREFFASLGEEGAAALADLRGASWAPRHPEILIPDILTPDIPTAGAAGLPPAGNGALGNRTAGHPTS